MSLKIHACLHTLKMLGCFNPTLGQIWTNPNVGLKMSLKNLTQWLGLSIFDPKLGWNNPAFFYSAYIMYINVWFMLVYFWLILICIC